MGLENLANLYALCTSCPLFDVPEPLVMFCCLPLEDAEDCHRYITLLLAPRSVKVADIYEAVAQSRPYSHQWITYVSFGGGLDG